MNVAAPASASLPSHFAPSARSPSTRRIYHQPTLHMRTGSNSSPRHSAQEFVNYPLPGGQQQQPPTQYSPSQPAPPFQRSPSARITTPQTQGYPAHASQQRLPLQRQLTAGSQNSLAQYIQPGAPMPVGHRRQTASTSTSNSSINRIPSGGPAQYPSTPPMIQTKPSPNAQVDTYVAKLRRAKATVWSARGQREDLDRSNSKDDKYNKKYQKRSGTVKVCIPL